jgi:Ca-activated chloride channel family protein
LIANSDFLSFKEEIMNQKIGLWLTAATLICLAFVSFSTAALAGRPSTTKTKDGERMVLVLDASGSMWGQIDGKPKIAIAKSVLAELVDELPEDLHVGLTVYGHRRKGDCKDIEMVVPVERIDTKAIKQRIEAISPKGKTPIAASLIQTAKTLKDAPGQKTIVLVTDGLESCDRDPCKVAGELAASGAVTKIHVVGFDLAGEAMDQLKCIAAPSGGLLVGARNAQELKSALTEVVTVSLPHNLVVKGLDANGKPLFVSARISKAGQQVARSSGSTLRYALPAGSYSVAVRHPALDQTIVLKDVAVEEDRLTEKEVVFAESKLHINSLDGEKRAIFSTAVVYRAGTDEQIKKASGSNPRFTLPPGAYDVKVSHGPTKTEQWLRNLETTAGGRLVKEVVFAQSKLHIKSLDGNHKAIFSTAVVYRAGTDEKIKKASGSNPRFTLLPGVYDVKVTCSPIKTDKWLRNIVLKAGDQIEKQVYFAFGKIKVTGVGPDGKKLYLGVTVYPAGSSDMIHRSTGGSPRFTLKPGAYDIRIRVSSLKAEKWLRGVAIEDGADIQQKVQF